MTQPNNKELEQWFEQWSVGLPLDDTQLKSLESSEKWFFRMKTHQQMVDMAEQMGASAKIPDWDRDKGFEQYLAKPSWWHRQGMSFVALSFSIFACLILLFDIRLSVTDGRAQLVSNNEEKQAWLQQQFVQLAQQNYNLINERMDDIKKTQMDDTAQLVSYVMANSRIERKEDIADVVRVIQQQRQDDMRYLRQQLSDVNYHLRVAQQRQLHVGDELNSVPQQVSD